MIRWLFVLVLAACAKQPVAAPVPASERLPVWIDTDPSVGVLHRDVDDGVALLQALRSPELEVRGVTTVFGNAPLDQADPIGRDLIAAWAPGLPVHRGAESPSRRPTPASEALIAALETGNLTILVLGPATNLATVVQQRPDLVGRIDQVIAVAGRLPGQRFTTGDTNPRSHRDFNFEQDPDAFQVLLDAKVPLTLAPFEISRKVWVDQPFLDTLREAPDAARLVEPALAWLTLWRDTFAVDGFNPFDTLAVGVLVRPDLIGCTRGTARIEVHPDDRTEAVMQGSQIPDKPYLVVRPPAESVEGTGVTWCADVESQPFLDDLRRRLTTPR